LGRVLLVWRLVVGSLRRRPVEAVLSVVAIMAATTTLTLGLALYGVTNHPYQTTRATTSGPDIVAMPANGGPSGLREVTRLSSAHGVVARGGPYPVIFPTMEFHGLKVLAIDEGRTAARSSIDQPYVTEGSWLRADGVVVERSFADELGLQVGDRVTLNGRSFPVVGLAVSAALPPYPQAANYPAFGNGVPNVASQDTGLIWTSEATARSLATAAQPVTYLLELRLSDPGAAQAFENVYANNQNLCDRQSFITPSSPECQALDMWSWLDIQKELGQQLLAEQRALLIVGWLLGLLAIASLAVVVGGRIAERTRRVGLLKAVGATPRLVAISLLVEYLVLALGAAAAGLVAGWLLAPLLTKPGAGLVGSAGAPSITVSSVGWVVAMALVVAIAAAIVPAVRAARTSTTAALADAAHLPKRKPMLIAASSRLPVPLLIGLRLAARRPRRMVLTAFSLAITVTTVVAVLTVHAHETQVALQFGPGSYSSLPNPHTAQTDQVLFVMTLFLAALASVNAIVITWVTWIDSRRSLAVARSLGASPRQIGAGLSTALLLPALPGAVAGLPLGVLLVTAVSHGSAVTVPPEWWLAAALVGTMVAMAALSVVPARIGARYPVVEILQAE
jgi:putative ABC transport system permease protein